ncbi:hypothetical protein L3X38_018337 [Prunus dulcis]|uniref:Uncharacterized protein n=1 Tax=Prunus dulcis TaxID=3755 RepID=A0AAD4W8V7_PRUDU|nr:hypothetical protein L3X38_018337 [Prunus dulcis]
MALTEASKEAVWLKRLAKEFGIAQDLVVIQSDSQSAICLVKNQVFHGRSKNIDLRYHRIRDWVNDGDIMIRKVHATENASDCLASHSSKVQVLFELALSCSTLKIEVEFLRVSRMILKIKQMSWKEMIFTRSLRLAKVEIVGKLAHLRIQGLRKATGRWELATGHFSSWEEDFETVQK